MAASQFTTERAALGSDMKKQIKYGSTSNHVLKREKYIKHFVAPEDTLQGIALKYGVTMEQIKRANKMWSGDGLFLRTTLDIPVPGDFVDATSPESCRGSVCISPVRSKSLSQRDSSAASASSVSNSTSSLDVKLDESNPSGSSSKEETIADFLIRIDSSIAQTKDKVKVLEKNIVDEDDIFSLKRGVKHSKSRTHFRQGSGSSLSSFTDLQTDPSIPPQPVVMTQGRKVLSSLRRLEREQDEMFEL